MFALANITCMEPIKKQLIDFFLETGCTQLLLSKKSKVPASTICLLLKGKRKNVIGPNQDALRKAMEDIRLGIKSPTTPSTTQQEDHSS